MKQQLLSFGLCWVLFSPLFLRWFFYFCLDVCFVFFCRHVLMSNQLSTPNFINTPDVTVWVTTCPPQTFPCGFTLFFLSFFFFIFKPPQTKIDSYRVSAAANILCLVRRQNTTQKKNTVRSIPHAGSDKNRKFLGEKKWKKKQKNNHCRIVVKMCTANRFIIDAGNKSLTLKTLQWLLEFREHFTNFMSRGLKKTDFNLKNPKHTNICMIHPARH